MNCINCEKSCQHQKITLTQGVSFCIPCVKSILLKELSNWDSDDEEEDSPYHLLSSSKLREQQKIIAEPIQEEFYEDIED